MYKVLQLTNQAIGTVAVGSLMPLGAITRRYGCRNNNGSSVFDVSTTGSNTVTLNEEGYYHLTYTASVIAGDAGDIIIDLLQNNIEVLSASQTVVADNDTANIMISFVIRVLPSCCSVENTPVTIQLRLDETSVALTGGSSNLIIEKTK